MHLATMEWRDGQPRAHRDHSQSVLYSQRGNDTAALFIVSEMYEMEPVHFVDVNLQSWTFGMRKAQLLEGMHYVFWSKEYKVVSLLTALKDTDDVDRQTYIPIRLKPRPKGREPFKDLVTVTGNDYFKKLYQHFAAQK